MWDLKEINQKVISKKFRNHVRSRAFNFLPSFLSHRYIRSTLNLKLPSQHSPLSFQVASTTVELKAALRLVQDGFVRAGYAGKNYSGLRITPYHLLPQTLVVLVKLQDRVIATLSIIPRTRFGVPLESCYQISSFLSRATRIVEISALAVDPAYRGYHGEILYSVMKFMYHCNVDLLDAEIELIGINPKMAPLYEAILLFDTIPNTAQKIYDFVNGAPVVPLYFDLRSSRESFTSVYSGKPAHLNLMDFFLAPLPHQFHLPKKQDLNSILPQQTADGLREILSWEPDLLKQLTQVQWNALESVYLNTPYLEILQKHRMDYAQR